MSATESPAAQIELFGPAVHTETHRLFFALMPDAATRHDINHAAALVQQQHPGLRARWVKPERFHATLNFLGDFPTVPDQVVQKAMAAADHLRAEPFSWTLDYAASFRGREPPCVLRGSHVPEPLLALWRDLHAALTHAGLHLRAERQFTPHVTLAYGRHELPGTTPVTPIVWQIDRFVLVHNVVGRGNYQILGSWKLAGTP
ncbi:RNA 2',3'-cyclic phosphodiesterase [Dyella humi]|uniref:RNA 2',3'-cyclic phosphodiesterase n=1 Tax=Dyella humi TaxID=1770547 RepID=A0ABW8IIH1_9GAMM